MAKGGKKGGKRATAVDEPAPAKGKKGKKGKGEEPPEEKGGKKGKGGKGRKSKRETVPPPEPVVTEPEPPPEPPKPACEDKARADDPCRYTEDACCREAIACRPNHYPGILEEPEKMAVVGSESGTYESICKLLRAGLRCADRVFIMSPWGNYVVFRAHNEDTKVFFIYDGCTCNVNRFRYLDLRVGTAGLLYFDNMHSLIDYMLESRNRRSSLKRIRKSVIDDICKEFCEFGYH